MFGINPSTVRVTWRYVAPTVKEEPLTGYKVSFWLQMSFDMIRIRSQVKSGLIGAKMAKIWSHFHRKLNLVT